MSDNQPGRNSLESFLTNLNVDMPFPRKVYLLVRNLSIRVVKRQDCCGHDGEPGC